MKKKDLPAFDYLLVEALRDEHRDIRYIYNRIMSAAVDRDYEEAMQELDAFHAEIRTHYKKADSELYFYIRTYVQIKHPKREKAFNQLLLEMKNISIEIYYIITQSPSLPLSGETYNGFMLEFLKLGKLMNERINREENVLFKMYEQTNQARTIS